MKYIISIDYSLTSLCGSMVIIVTISYTSNSQTTVMQNSRALWKFTNEIKLQYLS